jgi:1,2-diacylglycerol 3-alpha-glucosyltransferase
MKILHCCLACFYIDGYGYQENILPKMHQLQGHEVKILASTETFVNNISLGYKEPGAYLTETGIPITRLPYLSYLPHFLAKKLRYYPMVFDEIQSFSPDIIFLHDVQFLSIKEIVKYKKKHLNVIVYADGHTDFNVSARNWISKNILHKVIYKHCAKTIEPYLKKFYGVLPTRVDFIKDVYKIDNKLVELLVMGGDLTNVDFTNKDNVKSEIRLKYDVRENDFLIVTGGKIDSHKNIPMLMKAVNEIYNQNIKLIVFGSIDIELKAQVMSLSESDFIRYVGWKDSDDINKLFLAGNLAIFPGRHSVLWEQSAALGIPGVFKEWDGVQHIDVGGNALFLNDVSVDSIKKIILQLYNNKTEYEYMKRVAIEKAIPTFSYYEIAKRAIEQ